LDAEVDGEYLFLELGELRTREGAVGYDAAYEGLKKVSERN
jgi:hypothetical protein